MNKRIIKRLNNIIEKIDILSMEIQDKDTIGNYINEDRFTLLNVQYELLMTKYNKLQNKYNKETKDLQDKFNNLKKKSDEDWKKLHNKYLKKYTQEEWDEQNEYFKKDNTPDRLRVRSERYLSWEHDREDFLKKGFTVEDWDYERKFLDHRPDEKKKDYWDIEKDKYMAYAEEEWEDVRERRERDGDYGDCEEIEDGEKS